MYKALCLLGIMNIGTFYENENDQFVLFEMARAMKPVLLKEWLFGNDDLT